MKRSSFKREHKGVKKNRNQEEINKAKCRKAKNKIRRIARQISRRSIQETQDLLKKFKLSCEEILKAAKGIRDAKKKRKK